MLLCHALGMAEDLPPHLWQEEVASKVGPISPAKPSIIIPPKATRRGVRVLYKDGKPVSEGKGKKVIEGAKGEEEERQSPLHEEHRWFVQK